MMLYPADHQITVEELREFVFDDGEAEIFEDDRYEAWIARYPDDWRMAAYAAADRMYGYQAGRPNRIASEGDSLSWPDARITALKDKRDAIKADLDADGYGGIVTFTSDYLTGSSIGGDEWQ